MEQEERKLRELLQIVNTDQLDIITIINTDEGEYNDEEYYVVYNNSTEQIFIVDLKRVFYKEVTDDNSPEGELNQYIINLGSATN